MRPLAAGEPGAPAPWRLPAPFAAVVGRLPQFVPSGALAAALSLAIGRGIDPEALSSLRRRVIRFGVLDAGLELTVRCTGARFVPAPRRVVAVVTITSSLQDFCLLGARKEDPDTLFFARRLSIEGDTDAGLAVKNMLDAVDLSALMAWLERSLGRVARASERLRAGARA